MVRMLGIALVNASPIARSAGKLSLPPSHQSYIRAECATLVSTPGGAR